MGSRNASGWAPMDVSIGLAQCHGLQPSVVWTHIGLRAGPACPAVHELCGSYQAPCSDSSCGLTFQEERGSDRGPSVWFCIALPDKNILSLCGITENFNSIPKTSLPSQSIFLALSMLGSTDSHSRTCRIEWSWQSSCKGHCV